MDLMPCPESHMLSWMFFDTGHLSALVRRQSEDRHVERLRGGVLGEPDRRGVRRAGILGGQGQGGRWGSGAAGRAAGNGGQQGADRLND